MHHAPDAGTRAYPAPPQIADLLERVSDAFVALDVNWRYTFVNHHAAALFGRRPEDLIGKHIWTEFPEGVGQPFHLAYEKAMAEQRVVQIESYYPPWDRWFENRIYPSADGLAIFFHDVTARKLAERSARQSAALIEGGSRVLECIARGEPLADSMDTLLRLIEAQFPDMICSALALDEDGVHMHHLSAPSLPSSFIAAIEGAAIGPCAGSCGTAAFRKQRVVVEAIDTDPLWVDYRELALAHGLRACWSTPILDRAGRVLGTFALYFRAPGRPTARHLELVDRAVHIAAIAMERDCETRERERAEEEVRRRESQLAEAQRLAHLGSYVWDAQTDTVSWSEELWRIFGVTPEEYVPSYEGYLSFVHPDDRAATRRAIEESLKSGIPFEFDERIVRPDGTVRRLHSQGHWTFENGKPAKMFGICQDVTEASRTAELDAKNRQLEDEIGERKRVGALLERRNEELKAFAYTVSHDLKAPLRGIAGYAQELGRSRTAVLAERDRFCVEQILAGARSLDRLIEDLLQYSRLGAETPSQTDVDVAELVEGVLKERRALIGEQGVDVTLQLDAAAVHVWERGLRQVVTNLVDNALKYSRDAKPPRLWIATERVQEGIRVTVRDNGIGFDMQYHDRMFGLFNRLVRREDYEGTGAGLAIVQKIVEKMHGRVWAESSPGAGAAFFVELPDAAHEG